ncbi:type I 3-dehydroquinate dehydratase [Caenimonas aquaedulcis]|uniref:3-dehydroquinate dehydratase n=1 Tax=Caenimonas aquaedulcis TaxID=2793270 RepID=A0A931MFW7_9BURK|nr:type I 3-dehydroquinate dehydratase [Caenimonas aquaedulcis]MBG9387691.1 type I 3-dehydroquinate dehydratase [Caenimonas aquaedulcis]
MPPHAIQLPRNATGARFPAICAPLVGRTAQRLLDEVAVVAAKKPDILEWRVDFFEGIADTASMADLCGRIKAASGGIPLLVTRRSAREGGERIELTEAQVIALYAAVCRTGHVDLLDYEAGNAPAEVAEVREMTRAHRVQLLLSFHDFQSTPAVEAIADRFARAAQLGADIAKVAVMPRSMEDVLRLLEATQRASRELAIPVVSMSMGRLGAITRLCGWAFGSAMTFAIGESPSAPGQMAIEDVGAGLALLQKALRPDDL